MNAAFFIVLGVLLILVGNGCKTYWEPPLPKFQVGPDTYFEGPDWIPHDQKTIGEPLK